MHYQPQNLHCNYLNLVNLNIWTSCQLQWRQTITHPASRCQVNGAGSNSVSHYVSKRPWIQYMKESIHNQVLFSHIIIKQYHITQACVDTAFTCRTECMKSYESCWLWCVLWPWQYDKDHSYFWQYIVPLWQRKTILHVTKCLATGKKFYQHTNGRILNITIP